MGVCMSEVSASVEKTSVVEWRRRIFARSPLRRRLAASLLRLLEKGDERILEAIADDAVAWVVRHRAEEGPEVGWDSGCFSSQGVHLTRMWGEENTHLLELPKLPFEDGVFDAVVASGVLEFVEEPAGVMEEFHRVLAPKTRLVLHIQRKRKSVIGLFRRWAGLSDPVRERLHAGFTPTELFDALKDGFDVEETLQHGRFFTELTTLFAELFAGLVPESGEPAALDVKRLGRASMVFSIFVPFFWVAGVLDAICFFLPYHHMVIRAKRRMMWVPRVTPRLKDGRNIAEATLGYKIGVTIGDP